MADDGRHGHLCRQTLEATHQQDLRDTLAEILLDARYRLRDALVMPVTRANDPVRHWFIDSWQRLGRSYARSTWKTPVRNPCC